MFRQPTRVPVTMLAFRGRPPLWPAGQEYQTWMAAQTRRRFRTQLLSVAEIALTVRRRRTRVLTWAHMHQN
jgi:hypothetical protein